MNTKNIKKAIKGIDIKKTIGKVDIKEAFNTTKKALKNSNEFALTTADGVVTESLHVAEQWQKVTQKAINGGFKLADNQQDLVFQALEAVKGQYTHGKKRVTKLFA